MADETNLSVDEAVVSVPRALLKFSDDAQNELRRSIMVRLGDGSVKVEMKKEHLDEAIASAADIIAPIVAAKHSTYYIFQSEVSIAEYKLPDQVRYVYDVVYDPMGGSMFAQNLIMPTFLNTVSMGGDLSTYWTMLAKLEQTAKIYAMRCNWEYARGGKIRIAPTPSTTVPIAVRCITSMTDMDNYHFRAIRDYALAEAKCILAEIRGKYASVPSSQGMTQLNWEHLNQDGMAAKDAIVADVRAHNPVFFIVSG